MVMLKLKVLLVSLVKLTEDELWVIVKRTVNGATKRYVECFSEF